MSYLFSSISKIILFIGFPLLYCFITKDNNIKTLTKISGNRKYLKQAAILSGIVFVLIILVFILLHDYLGQDMIIGGLLEKGITRSTYPIVFLYIVFINAVLEEFFFRSFLFFSLLKNSRKIFAYSFSAILFSFYHISVLDGMLHPAIFLLCIMGLIAAGLIFNYISEKCETALGSYIVHAGANLAINLIGAYFIYQI